jgi:Flp pilus assembly secretin CpaC
VELGTGLRVQPSYREDGRIAMNLEVEVTDIAGEDALTVVRRIFKNLGNS